jgi:hypothetical protein
MCDELGIGTAWYLLLNGDSICECSCDILGIPDICKVVL